MDPSNPPADLSPDEPVAAEAVAVVVEWSLDFDGDGQEGGSSFDLSFEPPSEQQRQADLRALRDELRAKSSAQRSLTSRQVRSRAAFALRSRRLVVARIRARRSPRSRPARRLIRQGTRRATSRGDPSGRSSGTSSKEGEPSEISARFDVSSNGSADKPMPGLSVSGQISVKLETQRRHAGKRDAFRKTGRPLIRRKRGMGHRTTSCKGNEQGSSLLMPCSAAECKRRAVMAGPFAARLLARGHHVSDDCAR